MMTTVNVTMEDPTRNPSSVTCYSYWYDTTMRTRCSCGAMVTMDERDLELFCHCPKCGKKYWREGNELITAFDLDRCYHDD